MTEWIGPKPKETAPRFTLPLEVVGSTVQDSEGTTLFTVDLPTSYSDDCAFAQFLVETLNTALIPAEEDTPDPEPEEDFGPSGLYPTAWYRVSTFPLWYVYAKSQEDADRMHLNHNLIMSHPTYWTFGTSQPRRSVTVN
jgi:hypothetical protein